MYKVLEVKEVEFIDIGIVQCQSIITTTIFETLDEANDYFEKRKSVFVKLIELSFIDPQHNELILKKIEN